MKLGTWIGAAALVLTLGGAYPAAAQEPCGPHLRGTASREIMLECTRKQMREDIEDARRLREQGKCPSFEFQLWALEHPSWRFATRFQAPPVREVGGRASFPKANVELSEDVTRQVAEEFKREIAELPRDCPPLLEDILSEIDSPLTDLRMSPMFGSNPIEPIEAATDGGAWCTYGEGTPTKVTLVPSDPTGTPLAPPSGPLGRPTAPGGPSIAESPTTPISPPSEPTTVPEPAGEGGTKVTLAPGSTPGNLPAPPTQPEGKPGLPADTPSQSPGMPSSAGDPTTVEPPPSSSTPSEPKAAESTSSPPPESPAPSSTPAGEPTDTPASATEHSGEPVVVFVKATRTALSTDPAPPATAGTNIQLVPETPPLPELKTAQATSRSDDGFDQDPARCKADANGGCKVTIRGSQRRTYRLPPLGQHFVASVETMDTAGLVTDMSAEDLMRLSELRGYMGIRHSPIVVGRLNFTRITVQAPADIGASAQQIADDLAKDIGQAGKGKVVAEQDFCRQEQPGPWVEDVAAATRSDGDGLPHAELRLDLHAAGAFR